MTDQVNADVEVKPETTLTAVVEGTIALYSPLQVALASLLGTPLLGGWMIGRNIKLGALKGEVEEEISTDGRAKKWGRIVLLGALVLTAAYVGLFWLLEGWGQRIGLAVVQALVVYGVAGYLTPSIGEEGDDARLKETGWAKVAILGLAVLAVLVGVGMGLQKGVRFGGGGMWKYRQAQLGVGEGMYYQKGIDVEVDTMIDAFQKSNFLLAGSHQLGVMMRNEYGAEYVWVIGPQMTDAKVKAQIDILAEQLKNGNGNGNLYIRWANEKWEQIGEKQVK